MSATLELVRTIDANWKRGLGDVYTLERVAQDLEYVFVGGPTPGTSGRNGQ